MSRPIMWAASVLLTRSAILLVPLLLPTWKDLAQAEKSTRKLIVVWQKIVWDTLFFFYELKIFVLILQFEIYSELFGQNRGTPLEPWSIHNFQHWEWVFVSECWRSFSQVNAPIMSRERIWCLTLFHQSSNRWQAMVKNKKRSQDSLFGVSMWRWTPMIDRIDEMKDPRKAFPMEC